MEFAAIWNRAFDEPPRPSKERDYLYASELKGKPYDTVLSMLGVLPTSEPNARAKRKFQAGNLFEFIVKVALQNCGLYQKTQEAIRAEFDGILVSGRIDFLIGGTPNFENNIINTVQELELGDGFEGYLSRLQQNFKAWYEKKGFEFPNEVWEIKSVSALVFDGIELADKPKENHVLQLYHYVYNHPKTNSGRIIYICRDDLRLKEFYVHRSDTQIYNDYAFEVRKLRDLYLQHKSIDTSIFAQISALESEISDIYSELDSSAAKQPAKLKTRLENCEQKLAELREKQTKIINPYSFEKLVLINPTTGRLQANWHIEYSNYLTHYFYYDGSEKVHFTTPESYRNYVVKDINGINSVLNRVFKKKLEGKFDDKTLTKSNKEKIEILQNKYGYSFEDVYMYFEARQTELMRKGVTFEEDEDA
jgi:hypothetical protein